MVSGDKNPNEKFESITVHDIICALNPDLYYKPSGDKGEGKKELQAFKTLVKEKGILAAAEKAKPQGIRFSKAGGVFKLDPNGIEAKHYLNYESSLETMEPVYFFILELMDDFNLTGDRLLDNFVSSPGSGHFGDLGQRATIMQQQASRILGDINNVTRSVLNLVYDLKDFQIRLHTYDDLKSSSKDTRDAALLALKQIWMDKVDIAKGNTSMKAMAFGGQVGFQTLVDAFLFVKDESLKGPDGKVVDLNDRVKRVLKQRILEFNLWLGESEKELRKRYELERKYLKSQVNSIKLYSRWAKPYLNSALQLEMKNHKYDIDVPNFFNTVLLELTILAKTSKINTRGAAKEGKLPKEFENLKMKRDYFGCIVIDLRFRGIPQKTSPYQQHYVFGGRAEVTFTAYALNEDEIKIIKKEIEKADVGDALRLIEGATAGSIEEMEEDIEKFLKEEDEAEKKSEEKPQDQSNPFAAMFGFYNPKKEKPKSAEDEKLRSDDFLEKNYIRPMASENAEFFLFLLFDIYKKAHGMPSYTA